MNVRPCMARISQASSAADAVQFAKDGRSVPPAGSKSACDHQSEREYHVGTAATLLMQDTADPYELARPIPRGRCIGIVRTF